MTIAVVTNSITPYTNKLFEAFASRSTSELIVYQCTAREADRFWNIPQPRHYRLVTLEGLSRATTVGYVHFNPGIVKQLARHKPDVIVAGGFTPTMCAAGLYALATGRPYGLFFDGSRATDKGEMSFPHRILRRFIVPRASFAICPSEGNRELVRFWGMAPQRTKLSPWVVPWDPPRTLNSFGERRFDLLFSGRLVDLKNPMFLEAVLRRAKARGKPLSIRIIGHGPLREAMEGPLREACSHVQFDGNLSQEQLAEAYSSARLLAFPTLLDAWGLVANEAIICGTPVIASPHAVSSSELVEKYGLGKVCPLDADTWCDAILDMLSSEAKWQGFMARRAEAMESFSLERAVSGFAEGIALGRTLRQPGWRGATLPFAAAD